MGRQPAAPPEKKLKTQTSTPQNSVSNPQPPAPDPCCSSARPRWWATGSTRRRASRRSCACWSTTAPDRAKATRSRRQAAAHDVVVTSYALLHRDEATCSEVAWDGVVLDEAQNIKNPDTKQAQAARALQAGYRLALTGTPVENRLSELW